MATTRYDDAILKRVQKRWESFRRETKMSQTAAGKAMGMGQSAFGQYLRGDIPLNSDFLAGFEKLTGDEIVGAAATAQVGTIALPVKATLSGRVITNRRQPVSSIVKSERTFLVEVDYRSHFMPYGSFIIVSETDDVRHGDTVIYAQEHDRFVYGTLNNGEDGWFVTEPHFFGARSHAVDATSDVFRVSGTYFPEQKGAALKTK